MSLWDSQLWEYWHGAPTRIPADDHKPPVAFLSARSQGKQSRELEVVPGRFCLARAPLRLRSDTAGPPAKGSPVWKPGCLQSQRSWRRGLGCCCCCQPAGAKTESVPVPGRFQSGSNTAVTASRGKARGQQTENTASTWASQTVIKKSASLTAINTPQSVFTRQKAATPRSVKPVLQRSDTSPPGTSLGGT